MVSSTSVTLSFARLSGAHPELSVPLAQGVLAANTVVYVRVVIAAAVLSPALATALVPWLAAPFLIGLVAVASGMIKDKPVKVSVDPARNPLQLRSALEMALLFQAVLVVVHLVRQQAGDSGLLATAAIVGLNDADALTLSMAKNVTESGMLASPAARAVTVGLLSNTLVKAGLAAGVGRGRFHGLAVGILLVMAVSLAAGAIAIGRWEAVVAP